jgi:hypothetical protein
MKRVLMLIAVTLVYWTAPGARPHAAAIGQATSAPVPSPLLTAAQPVDWWFMFKFNAKSFPECGAGVQRSCPFGGTPQQKYAHRFGQQFAFASSADHELQQGVGCAGESSTDPLGATFGQVYTGQFNYVVWNDQFKNHPALSCESNGECGAPWGHSKGMVAWNDDGNGLVLQVSTPSWPASGSTSHPRTGDGNTLGCVDDNDVLVSQHFFSLKLSKDDLVQVLMGLANASVVTDTTNLQIVKNGGPSDIQTLVKQLGSKATSTTFTKDTLSSGVTLIAKPSGLHVPPWQLVSSALGGVPLRAATWWATPPIPSTTPTTNVACWNDSLGKPGAVEIATSGSFGGQVFGFKGQPQPDGNHAKIGVSSSGAHAYSIFGDMNQQGSLSGPNCASSQNGRGGLFFVVDDVQLHASVADLIKGETAPAQ